MGCFRDNKTDYIINEVTDTAYKHAEINTLNDETKPLIHINPDDELLIMVRADGAPGMSVNDHNELEGFYVELEETIMKEMNQKYRLIPYNDISKVIQQLKIGEVHSALATPDVPDFRLLTNISTPYELLTFTIFLPENNNESIPDNRYDAIRFLYGKKVGVQTRGHIYQHLRDHPEIELLEYPTTTIALEALHRGEVDAVPEVKRIGTYYAQNNNWRIKDFGPTIFELNIGTGFSKKLSQDIVYRYNTTLQRLIDSRFVDALYRSYFEE